MQRRDFFRMSAAGVAAGALPRSGPLKVHILLFDGAEEQDFVGPLEVFGLARVETTLVRHGGPGRIVATHGTRIDVQHGWDPKAADILIVPGGGYGRRDGPGVHQVVKDKSLLSALVTAHRSGVVLAAVCTGTMVLSAAGLTRGRPCTTHARAKADLVVQGGTVIAARVVDDGDLVTAGGITSGLDLGLWLVTRELGADRAVTVEAIMEYESRGTVWRSRA
ncbi:DJ-1/PfpI family protein [Allokutzneria oryzae]|uniref:DJ-1/PfpI family protein n=1 Tax=Allokutzneria oryzae TaxID=1378989 RepID=A0ABV5ZWI5_9PSEU